MFFYDGIMLRIGNYTKINLISPSYIEIVFKTYLLKINGELLKIISLNDSDFYIQGNISKIEWGI